jgi:hypothetical protein
MLARKNRRVQEYIAWLSIRKGDCTRQQETIHASTFLKRNTGGDFRVLRGSLKPRHGLKAVSRKGKEREVPSAINLSPASAPSDQTAHPLESRSGLRSARSFLRIRNREQCGSERAHAAVGPEQKRSCLRTSVSSHCRASTEMNDHARLGNSRAGRLKEVPQLLLPRRWFPPWEERDEEQSMGFQFAGESQNLDQARSIFVLLKNDKEQ